MDLDENVQQVLIGSLLGDGGVYIPNKHCQNARFSEAHSAKQSNYLKWKAELLYPHFGSRLRAYTVKDTYKMICFETKVHPILTTLRKLWYPNGKKVVPEEELQKLDALGLAVWYMDDGNYNYPNRTCRLSIHSFRSQELAIQRWFVGGWGLNPHITYGPTLQFSVKDSDKLLHLIAEHVHPSMTYKLGHLHSTNRTRAEIALEKNREYRKEYRRKNREKVLRIHRKSYWKNRETILQREREYRQRRKCT